MVLIAVDFILKNAGSLKKWGCEYVANALTSKLGDAIVENNLENSEILIEKSDHEVLQRAGDLLKEDFNHFTATFSKKSQLLASYEQTQLGIAVIRVSKCEG